ncbi:hypothetical protein [Mycoplasma zalophi]|nr:hypothetical protein [Mycoplasma zalophi]MBU4690837.1 hypothetical protein [Mycoplasma zalophi]
MIISSMIFFASGNLKYILKGLYNKYQLINLVIKVSKKVSESINSSKW